jgi:hypothetical protein
MMLENSPAPPLPSHVVGQCYDFHAVRAGLGGEKAPPYFVIHRDGKILGLCLGLMWHPMAESEPCEVWVGRKGDLPSWGRKLAETTGPLPIYVRREEGGKWFYIGRYEVTGSSREPGVIRPRLKPPVIAAISRIIFLKRFDTTLQPATTEQESSGNRPLSSVYPAAPIDADQQPEVSESIPQLDLGASQSHHETNGPKPEINSSDLVSERAQEVKRVHPRDPLHGVKLETIVSTLVERHGWVEMGSRIPVRCFLVNPSVKSSLTFLRKTPWAREKVESWFIGEL